MAISKEIQNVINSYNASGFPSYSSLSPTKLRQIFNQTFHNKPKETPIVMAKVETKVINSPDNKLKIRIYYPSFQKKLPALMYFHGGGFVIRDDMDIYDQTCRRIASKVGCIVIAVDYRLAPEHPFPAAPEDCFFATNWVFDNAEKFDIDSAKIGVWGESCGGNLAAVIAMMARDKKSFSLVCQIIVSPMLDIDYLTDSYNSYSSGYILTKDTMKWFWQQYLSKQSDISNPYALPIKAVNFDNLAPALIFTTELDVLRDDGRLYADLLFKSNTKVKYKCYEGLLHGFFDLYTRVNKAKIACDEIMFQTKLLLS